MGGETLYDGVRKASATGIPLIEICNKCVFANVSITRGRNQLFISEGGGFFMKFHSMTSSCFFNRGTTFSQTVTDKFFFATFPKMRTFQF